MSVSPKILKEPSGELVEVDFYFSKLSSADAIKAVTRCCLNNGGECGSKIYLSQFNGARNAKFEGIYSDEETQLEVTGNDLLTHFSDENKRIVRVPVQRALGISKKSSDVVTFSGISASASQSDSHPVAIVAEGWVFSTPGYSREAAKAGKQCYRRFIDYCQNLQPDYAAILNENSLSCRHDLKRGRGKDCFCDFFVNSDVYGERLVSELEEMYSDSYLERSSEGLYVSTTSWYNPKKKNLDRLEAREISRRGKVVDNVLADLAPKVVVTNAGQELRDLTIKGWRKGKGAPHFTKHGQGLGFNSLKEYTEAAKQFQKMAGQVTESKVGNLLFKYDHATKRILIVSAKERTIVTFYKANNGIRSFQEAMAEHWKVLQALGH